MSTFNIWIFKYIKLKLNMSKDVYMFLKETTGHNIIIFALCVVFVYSINLKIFNSCVLAWETLYLPQNLICSRVTLVYSNVSSIV